MMMNATKTNGDRSSREEVANTIRRRIVIGQYRPGEKLPTRDEIGTDLQASYVTVQRALDLLREEGFIHSSRGRGTFVVDHPPHLHRYVLVLPEHPTKSPQEWSRFRQILAEEAELITRDLPPRRMDVFFDVDPRANTETYRDLVRMVESGQLAGLVFPNRPDHLVDTPLFTTPGILQAMVGHPHNTVSGVPCCGPDTQAFLDRSLHLLAQQGRRRVACLAPGAVFHGTEDQQMGDFIAERAAAFGLETHPYWNIPVSPRQSEGVRRTVQLLMSNPDNRPDGLVLFDDHLTTASSVGLLDAEVRVPEDLTLIGYCNFPNRPQSNVPITRLGFDCRALLRRLVDYIDLRNDGKRCPMYEPLPPVFEDELPYEISGETDY